MIPIPSLIFILLGFSINFVMCEVNNPNEITVSHRILEQKLIYDENHKITSTFIDFINYKIYKISVERIFHKEESVDFQLKWDKNGHITFGCFNDETKRIKCSDIDLSEHSYTSFEYDRLTSKIGGISSYLLILYGIFCLSKGYIYFNLTILFYGSFGFILFVREVFELLELIDLLSSETDTAEIMSYIIFYGSLLTSILYGFVCLNSKYLKYITFGFINGLLFSKSFFFYLLIRIITISNLTQFYFIFELFSVIIFILLFIIFQNKYPIISITYIVLMASYGIIYAFNVLFGGISFIPFLILAKKYEDFEEIHLYKLLIDGLFKYFYLVVFFIMVGIGIYKNKDNYNILMNRGKTK